jgi:hypothetical protein
MPDNLRLNGRTVEALRSAISDGSAGLNDVPGILIKVITEGMWKRRLVQQTSQEVRFRRFIEFVEAQPPEGLGTNIKMLRRLCADEAEALDLIDRVAQTSHGGDRRSDNFKFDNVKLDLSETGNSRAYALRRLRKDRPDLHARILLGEISPHQAMKEAGFRRKTLSVPYNPVEAARVIAKRFSKRELRRFASTLKSLLSHKAY